MSADCVVAVQILTLPYYCILPSFTICIINYILYIVVLIFGKEVKDDKDIRIFCLKF